MHGTAFLDARIPKGARQTATFDLQVDGKRSLRDHYEGTCTQNKIHDIYKVDIKRTIITKHKTTTDA